MKQKMRSMGLVFLASMTWCATGSAQALQPLPLVKPDTEGGRPLMQALKARQSQRAISAKKLTPQTLSNLLWAACGVNRADSGRRTAPSAVNWQEVDVYVALAQGLYLYDAKAHALTPVLAADIRAGAGRQGLAGEAPVDLIYVADRSRMGKAEEADKDFYSATDTGYISQNVYLFCASEGLATVVLGMVDRPALAKKMGLRPDQKIMLTQPVGYPKE
jgi:SagB-type dehydrogenase family enzyme